MGLLNAVAGLCFWGLLLTVGTFHWQWQPDAATGDVGAQLAIGVTIPAPVVATATTAAHVTGNTVLKESAQAMTTSVSTTVAGGDVAQASWTWLEGAFETAMSHSQLLATMPMGMASENS